MKDKKQTNKQTNKTKLCLTRIRALNKNVWLIGEEAFVFLLFDVREHCSLKRNDNVPEWGNMSILRLLFQWASTMKIQISVLI